MNMNRTQKESRYQRLNLGATAFKGPAENKELKSKAVKTKGSFKKEKHNLAERPNTMRAEYIQVMVFAN